MKKQIGVRIASLFSTLVLLLLVRATLVPSITWAIIASVGTGLAVAAALDIYRLHRNSAMTE